GRPSCVSRAMQAGSASNCHPLSTSWSGATERLTEALPPLARVAVLWKTRAEAMTRSCHQIEGATRAVGLAGPPLGVQEVPDCARAFTAITVAHPDALCMIAEAFPIQHRPRPLACASNRLPTMFTIRAFVDAGGLMS